MLGSELIARYLEEKRIKRVFTFPGGTIAPLYDAIVKKNIEIICACHEQGAGYAALASSRLNNKAQIVLVTSGPGVTNIATVVADAYFDSTPLIVICGQVGSSDILADRKVRQRGFQQIDTVGFMGSISKKIFQPLTVEALPETLEDAFIISEEGRPGPVIIDLPMDVQRSTVNQEVTITDRHHKDPYHKNQHHKNRLLPNPDHIKKAIKWLSEAERPMIFAGQGVLLSRANQLISTMAEKLKIPVVTSLLGIGSISTRSPYALGFVGHTGSRLAGCAIHESDCVIVAGARLDVRQTGTSVENFVPNGRVIRIDVDENELKYPRVKSDLNIFGDAKIALERIYDGITKKRGKDLSGWHLRINELKHIHDQEIKQDDNAVKPQSIIEAVNHITDGKRVVVVSGVGSHQQWVARHFDFDFPERTWLTSGGHGAMGYDLPTAVGAQLDRPEDMVICFVGDGSIQINLQELQTAINYNTPIKIFVLDNKRLAMVSQFQLLNWGADPTTGNKKNPDFDAIAKAYGFFTRKITKKQDTLPMIENAISCEGPALVHCIVDSQEDVSPMLLPDQPMNRMWPYE